MSDPRIHLWGKYANGYWEHIDTADEDNPKDFLLDEYRMAFGPGWQFTWMRQDHTAEHKGGNKN